MSAAQIEQLILLAIQVGAQVAPEVIALIQAIAAAASAAPVEHHAAIQAAADNLSQK